MRALRSTLDPFTAAPVAPAGEGKRSVHHKRRRPKNRRAGCLFCKPHKANGGRNGDKQQVRKERLARRDEREQRADADVR